MLLGQMITIAVFAGVFFPSSTYICWLDGAPEPSKERLKPAFMDYVKHYGGDIILCLIFSLFAAAIASGSLLVADEGRIFFIRLSSF